MLSRITSSQQIPSAELKLHFTDIFGVSPRDLAHAGAFNISLVNDLPLFIDPFLLFTSEREDYRALHDEIIRYLKFLRDKATPDLNPELVPAWFVFREVKQTWLGFSEVGNQGRGLGLKFAKELRQNLYTVLAEFGSDTVAKASHLEKLCLINPGVGRDSISDFTTNLIKRHLLEYTQEFALRHIAPELRRDVAVQRVRFNYATESWGSGKYNLPWLDGDYVLLTPKDILTKDETWINRYEMIEEFSDIVAALPNAALRAQLNNYLASVLPEKPKQAERRAAIEATIQRFPDFIDYFIRHKEDTGDSAVASSNEQVKETQTLFVQQIRQLVAMLWMASGFYTVAGNTRAEALERINFLKDVIENKGGHHIFYVDGKPIRRERDVHILFRLTWFATPSDVSREVNDGRGPADFKISRGALDKTIVEFKLAKNTHLKKNLQKQAEIYQAASDAAAALKVIVYFSLEELQKVNTILNELKLQGNPNIILIDARADNKVSASAA